MSFPHHIFRAYDIRGVVENELTPALVERIGLVLGNQTLAQGASEFLIGRDGRQSSPLLTDALQRGVLASGCDVLNIGLVPTPVLYFSALHYRIGSGVQVTGSHNPPQYNGLKMMLAGSTLFGDAIQKIKQSVLDDDSANQCAKRSGKMRSADVLPAYSQEVVENLRGAVQRRTPPLKVVIDCGNGVAGVIAPQLFRAIGCSVVELFCDVDGTFPNHHPDPSRPENLQDLIVAVQQNNADFGMAFDGDGDRLGIVSNDGSILWPDRLMQLFAASILAERPGAEIIFDVKCSQMLARAINAHGGIATMCRTGHSFIKHKLHHSGAAFAGEMSGHLFFNDRWGGFDDGMYSGARLCEILAAESRTPGEVFAALPDSVNTPELVLQMAQGTSHKLVAELVANADFADAKINTMDGLRVDFADGFGLVRASNTTSALSMRFEASNKKQLAMIQSRFRRLIQSTGRDLDLPF